MDTISVRSLILNRVLAEEAVTSSVWPGSNLVIRELSGSAGSALIDSVTLASGKLDQTKLVADIVIATLRNADDPQKSLVFCIEGQPDVPNYVFRDALMSTGLSPIMNLAQQCIKLSGLDQAAVDSAKNGSSVTPAAA